MSIHDALPVYTVRRSAKAKRIHLKISPQLGLEVVIPVQRKRFNITRILSDQKVWIEKWLQRIYVQNSFAVISVPEMITFLAVDKTLLVHEKIRHHPQPFAQLKQWLKKQARLSLVPWLERLSQEVGLSYTHVSIRSQSTLWGSCSARGRISLNAKLLFLPPAVVQYVLIHELCHLRHLNHSQAFWSLVARYDPNYHEHRQMLKQAQPFLPDWLER